MQYRIFGLTIMKRGGVWHASAITPGHGTIQATGSSSREAVAMLSDQAAHLRPLAPHSHSYKGAA